MKIYRVGMLGFGFIGKVHAYGHRNLPLFYNPIDFGSTITKVCTSSSESAAKAAATLGNSTVAVTDYRQITEDPQIDIVDICTPNSLHCEALLSAIAHGKHIYCDKPLTSTVAEALAVGKALNHYHAIAQMTLQNRFFPATLRAKELIAEGAVGEILEFRAEYLHSGNANPDTPLKWKLEAGTIADLGSHVLDLMDHLLGGFSSLTAATHIAYRSRRSATDLSRMVPVTAEDNMFVLAKLANGATGIIRASKIATGAEDHFSFEINGSKGAIRWDPMNLDQLFFYDATVDSRPLGGRCGWTAIDCGQRYAAPAGFPTPKAPIGWLRGHMHCLYTFLRSVHDNHLYGPSLEQGIRIQMLMEKVKESARTGQWVTLE
ncbi:MAG: Gfo/Idh/MocA family oxidoreductase [Victivallaceae bacterium]|nr:Gfo/Idh/MocA family oxidoreductase [Victivallaceae bacterium]